MNDLFTPDPNDHNQIDPDKDYFEELVGENKKFKTVQELAKAKMESDNYIKTLEKGRDELREDYLKALEAAQTGPQVKEMLDQLLSGNAVNTPAHTPANDVNAPQLDPKQIEEMLSNKFREYEETKRAQDNYAAVEAKLKEAYGNNYRDVFQQKVREMGLSMEWAKQTALTYPNVLYKALDLDQPRSAEPFQTPPSSSQRRDNFAPNVVKRDWDFYEKMRKDNPTLYWNPKTQVQLHQDSRNPDFKTQSWSS